MKKIVGRASKYGGNTFQEFFFVLMNGGRGCRLELFMHEYIEMNGSAQNGSEASCKRQAYPYIDRAIPYRTGLKSRVNAAGVLSAFYVITSHISGVISLSSLSLHRSVRHPKGEAGGFSFLVLRL